MEKLFEETGGWMRPDARRIENGRPNMQQASRIGATVLKNLAASRFERGPGHGALPA